MKRMTHTTILIGAILLCTIGNPVSVLAVGESIDKHIMIAEVSPEAADTGTKEYIYLYNPNSINVEVTGWMVQYRSASHKPDDTKGWSTKAVLGCMATKAADCETLTQTIIKAGETLRLSSYETETGISSMSSGMATSGGQVRLVQSGQDSTTGVIVYDKVGYGTAMDFEGMKAAPAPKAGRSIVRVQDGQGAYTDTDHNDADFVLSPDEDAPSDTGGGSSATGEGHNQDTGVSYAEAEITEILPDPASPQLDSADEFIELYNPHEDSLDLTGYVLKTGTNWTHKYTIKDIVIEAHDYVALVSAQTHLSLSNSGTGVRLYDPAGKLLYEVPSYGKAQVGHSWIRDGNGQWIWTTRPTPGEQNTVELPPTSSAVASTTKKSASKAASSSKKTSTPKVTSTVKGVATTADSPTSAQSSGNQTGLWVLGGAALLGVGYALFEYRQDIGGFFRRRWEAVRRALGRNK